MMSSRQAAARPTNKRPRVPRAKKSEREALKAGTAVPRDEAMQRYFYTHKVQPALIRGEWLPERERDRQFFEKHWAELRAVDESERARFAPAGTEAEGVEEHRR